MTTIHTSDSRRDPREATTVKIRKDRYGNAYMADTADDLVDSATLIHRAKPEGALLAAVTQAITHMNEGRGWEAKQCLIQARAAYFRSLRG